MTYNTVTQSPNSRSRLPLSHRDQPEKVVVNVPSSKATFETSIPTTEVTMASPPPPAPPPPPA